jgi:putative ABC transport system permease protein
MLRVTFASLLARRLRLILTAATIVIGVAFVTGTFILTDSLQRALGVPAPAAAQVVVQPAGADGGKGSGSAAATLPARLVARIRAVQGVASAAGLVIAAKVTLTGQDGRPITHARAVNEVRSYPAAPALAAQYTMQSGRPPRRPDEAVLDAATAGRLGYRIGDPVGVVTLHGTRTLTVVGITGFDGAASPAAEQVASFDTPTVLLVPTATAQQLAGLPGRFTEIDAEAARGLSAAALRGRIARVLPPGSDAVTGQQAAAQQAATAASYLGGLRNYLLAFCAVALLVAASVITSTFSILAAQRGREHALLRVLGASRGQLLRSVLAEATAVGLAASAVGVGLGILAAFGLRGIISLVGGTLPAGGLVLEPRTAAVALAVGTTVTVVSALRPARRAARVAPISALRAALPAPPGRSPGWLGAGPLAHVMAAPIARAPTAARGSVAGRLARGNITRNRRRTAATAATLTIGLAVAATVSIIAASARASAQDAIHSTSRADLYLQGSISPGLARAVAARPGVRAVMRIDDPLAEVSGIQARVAGIDPAGAALLMNFGVRSGTVAALHDGGLLVSTGVAGRHGWHIGSRVTINFGQGPPRTLLVAGTFADKRFLGDDYLVSITTLFRDMPDQQADAGTLLVRAASGTRPLALRAAIAMICTESVITCLLGALPGAALGVAAGTALAITLTRDQTGVATLQIPAGQLAAVLVLTCLAGLLAAAVPARYAGRVPIRQAISE